MNDKPNYTPAEVAEMMGTYWATRTAIDNITSILGSNEMASDNLEGPRKSLEIARQLTYEHALKKLPPNVVKELREPYL